MWSEHQSIGLQCINCDRNTTKLNKYWKKNSKSRRHVDLFLLNGTRGRWERRGVLVSSWPLRLNGSYKTPVTSAAPRHRRRAWTNLLHWRDMSTTFLSNTHGSWVSWRLGFSSVWFNVKSHFSISPKWITPNFTLFLIQLITSTPHLSHTSLVPFSRNNSKSM